MRIQSIDFLRGIAILLVVFRHIEYDPIFNFIGWSGVDLFFVLSGFLVSGLLFSEYKKTQTIQPFRFLARRGFKIYPLFWIMIIYCVIAHNFTGTGTKTNALLAELFFFQNYSEDNILGVTWSLAVEEHFYLLLIIAVYFGAKTKAIENKRKVHIFAFIVLTYVLVARVIANIQHPDYDFLTHYAPTHIRIDSLAFGALIAYNYHFNREWLSSFTQTNRYKILAASVLLLIPMLYFSLYSPFMRTVGYTFTYIGYGGLLCLFLFVHNIMHKMNKWCGTTCVDLVCEIGTYSYAIYLTHLTVANFVRKFEVASTVHISDHTLFVCYTIFSIILGGLVTNYVEKPFLILREKIVPAKPTAKAKTKPNTEIAAIAA
jgi:peptidoglycan/LPS O-acetylase OafA/YrhL